MTGPRSHCKSEVAYEASGFPSPAALTLGLKLWPKETESCLSSPKLNCMFPHGKARKTVRDEARGGSWTHAKDLREAGSLGKA